MHGWSLFIGKISLSFKTMKNTKIVDSVLTVNSCGQIRYVTKKNFKIPKEVKFGGISLQQP